MLTAAFLSLLSNLGFIRNAFCLDKVAEFSGIEDPYRTRGYTARDYGQKFHDLHLEGPSARASDVSYGPYGREDIYYRPQSAVYEPNEALWYDRWRIYRHASVRATYVSKVNFDEDSNNDSDLDSSKRGKGDDVFFTYAASVGIGRREKRYYVRMFYSASYTDYIENRKLENFTDNQLTEWGYKFERVSLDFYNSLSPNRSFFAGDRSQLGSSDTVVRSFNDNAGANFNYKISPKTTAGWHYRYVLNYYSQSQNESEAASQSSQRHSFGPHIFHRVTPRLTVHADHTWNTIDYFDEQDDNSDSGSRVSTVGFTYARPLTAKTFASVSVNYRYTEFDNEFSRPADGLVVSTALFKRITKKVSGSVYYVHAIGEGDDSSNNLDAQSVQDQSTITDTVGGNLTWAIRPRLSFNADASATFPSGGDNTDNTENGDTAGDDSDGDTYRYSLGLNWRPRSWHPLIYLDVFVGFDHIYHDRDSNDFNGKENSDDDRFIASIGAGF